MSNNFELTQQIEPSRASESLALPRPGAPSYPRTNGASGRQPWAAEEALRLVQQVFLLQTQEPPRVAVFAGIEHGNGCSQICASVAETLAINADGPVCLVDANFRSPSLSDHFKINNQRGLTDALLKKGSINSLAKPVSQESLWLLPSGELAADSPNLLTPQHLRDRLLELRSQFAFVIIDAPPLTRYSDAILLGQLADGMVLVIEAESTRREAASAAADSLRSANVPILAAVLNKREFPIPDKVYSWL